MSIKTGCEYVGHIDPWTDEERLSDEEIVRCRDCKHYHGEFKGCDEFGDESRGEYAKVGPGGYCAWAERRASQ